MLLSTLVMFWLSLNLFRANSVSRLWTPFSGGCFWKLCSVKLHKFFKKASVGSLFFVKLQTLMPSVSSPSKCFPVTKLIWICLLIVSFESKFLFLNRSDLRTDQYPAANYIFKVNDRNIRTMCEICLKLTIKIAERRHCRRSGIFTVNFEHISHLVLVFLLLTLSR